MCQCCLHAHELFLCDLNTGQGRYNTTSDYKRLTAKPGVTDGLVSTYWYVKSHSRTAGLGTAHNRQAGERAELFVVKLRRNYENR